MKKIVVVMMALMVLVAFSGMAFAAVGHVGHVDNDRTVVVDDFTTISSDDITVTNGTKAYFKDIEKNDVVTNLPNFSFVGGLPADKTYEMTVYNAVWLDVTGYTPPLILDFTVSGDWTGVMIERKAEENVFDYFSKEGEGTIKIGNPSDYFGLLAPDDDDDTIGAAQVEDQGTGILFVELEEVPTSTGGGGGGGCSLGMLSPFALLLAVPLVLLRK